MFIIQYILDELCIYEEYLSGCLAEWLIISFIFQNQDDDLLALCVFNI